MLSTLELDPQRPAVEHGGVELGRRRAAEGQVDEAVGRRRGDGLDPDLAAAAGAGVEPHGEGVVAGQRHAGVGDAGGQAELAGDRAGRGRGGEEGRAEERGQEVPGDRGGRFRRVVGRGSGRDGSRA
ncbi:MAG: hypothetical protein IPL61_24770 [Myxococcales bacterium]|nr:hypothetical protein [Myxococcales bacterium]